MKLLYWLLMVSLCSCATPSSVRRNPADVLAELGTVGRQGGVTHGPVTDQRAGEICWSYTLADMAEDQYIKNHGAYQHIAHPSPEYLLFWHLYAQIKGNLSAYTEDANAIAAYQKGTKDQRLITRAQHALAAYPIDPNQAPQDKAKNPLFDPGVGNIANLALQEVKQFGMVPDDYFMDASGNDLAFTTDAQEKQFEDMIPHFIGQVVLKNYADYRGAKADINMALYNDLVKEFGDILGLTSRGIKMPLPSNSFKLEGSTYTPLTYMKNYLGYDPDQYEAFAPTKDPENQKLALSAIAYSIRQNIPAPVGIELFQDKDPTDTQDGDKNDAWSRAEATGLFTTDYCPVDDATKTRQCHDDAGGHEILGVNYLYQGSADDPNVTAIIIQNSWGRMVGTRTVNGVVSTETAHSGYFIITADYLAQDTANTTGSWDFVLPKSVATLPQFKALTPE